MALYQGARTRLLPEANTQPTMRATQVILHVAVSEADSLYGYWTTPGVGLESHFYVAYSGAVEQYVDTSHSADANLTANRRPDGTGAISVETAGLGPGSWTPEQLDALLGICRWARDVHGVPLQTCPGPDAPGIGWHVMWGAPGPWTPRSKVCPGPARVEQFKQIIMPRLAGAEEVDMPLTDADVAKVVDGVWRKVAAGLTDSTHSYLPPLHSRLTAVEGRMAGMQTAMSQLAAGNTDPAALQAAIEDAMRKVLGALDNTGSGNA